MRIIFDLMGTVLGSLDHSPRPGIEQTISALREAGARVEFWTSGRVEDYRALLTHAGISGDVYSKMHPLPFAPDLCVDDEPQSWMPGQTYKVDPHISKEMAGGCILAAELLAPRSGKSFYWD